MGCWAQQPINGLGPSAILVAQMYHAQRSSSYSVRVDSGNSQNRDLSTGSPF